MYSDIDPDQTKYETFIKKYPTEADMEIDEGDGVHKAENESTTNQLPPIDALPPLKTSPTSSSANSFWSHHASRRRLTPRTHFRRHPNCIVPRFEDDLGHNSYYDPQGSATLEYDEQPAFAWQRHQHDDHPSGVNQKLHTAQANLYVPAHAHLGRDDRTLQDRSVIERFDQALPVYERPEKPPSAPPFQGYDDYLTEESLAFIWRRLQDRRLPQKVVSSWQASSLTSYEREELDAELKKERKIYHDRERDRENRRRRGNNSSECKVWHGPNRTPLQNFEKICLDFLRAILPSAISEDEDHSEGQGGSKEAHAANTAYWDNQKRRNGPNTESSSYIGPGPERELLEATESFAVKETNLQSAAIKDIEMDESPYNDRRRDGGSRRGGRQGYGGGGGGGGGRKRGREEDGEDHREYRRQRTRYEEPVASRLRRDIIYVGEGSHSTNGVQDHCAGFGLEIANNFEDDQVRGPLLDTLVDMLCEQPLKIPFLAAVALYGNRLNADVGREFIARASKKMAKALVLGDWRDFKLLLRFHACLQDVLEGDGVFQILNQLFDWVIDLQSASADDALGLELTKVILLTIPYAITASPDAKTYLSDILDKTEIVAGEAANHPLATLVDAYPANSDDKPFGYQSVVEMLQKQLREESNRDWEFKCIPRVYVPSKTVKAENENGETGITKHALPALTVPVPVDVRKKPLFPETFFTMFADQDIQTVPNMNDISLSLIRDTMADSISILHYNRLAVASYLTQADDFWAPGTFATRGITLDQLRNYPAERSTWKPEDMFIDAVFSQLLALPDAKQKLIYYHSIIFEACKLAPSAVAPTLGRGIRWLFRHIDDMDLELLYRYLDWFAHHLSNFEFRWKWTEWIDELERSDLTPKKAFIIAAVDKEVRLSFAKRIRDTLPEAYYSLLTEGKFKDIPPFKYEKDDTPFASEGKEIYNLMKRKAPEEQIEPYIEAIREQASNHGLDPILASTDVYVTAMCHNGAKSVSHITAAIDRSKDRLQNARQESAGVGRQIVESVVTYWKDQPGNAVNIVDKLLNYTIVTPDSVIEWALGAESLGNGAALAQSWRYEIVAKTVGKVTGRVQQIVQAKVKMEVEASHADTAELEVMQPQIGQMNDLLTSEREAMRQLFATIEDAVAGVASGAADGFIDSATSDEDAELVKAWGEKWARVFRRKLAVEEAHVGEVAVEAQLVSAKEQDKLAKERAAREAEEEAAARAKEEEERAARIKKEEEEKAAANGDAAMDGVDMNGNGDAEDLDVAE